jgi:hypothetical protein|tara:strand:- start:770 stop:1036 length:267 start_codon:yes stop_codon:yes gene_type:complete
MNKAHFKAQAYDELKDKLLEDLKSECAYIQAKEEDQSWRYNDDGEREDTQYNLTQSGHIKDYLEGVLGVTFVWSDNKNDWIQVHEHHK